MQAIHQLDATHCSHRDWRELQAGTASYWSGVQELQLEKAWASWWRQVMVIERSWSAAVAASCAGRVGSQLAAVSLDGDHAADCAADVCHVIDCAAAGAAGLGLQQPSEQGRPALAVATAVGQLCEGSGARATGSVAAATSFAQGL